MDTVLRLRRLLNEHKNGVAAKYTKIMLLQALDDSTPDECVQLLMALAEFLNGEGNEPKVP